MLYFAISSGVIKKLQSIEKKAGSFRGCYFPRRNRSSHNERRLVGKRIVEVPYTVAADTFSGGLQIPGLNSGIEFELENWELTKVKWGQIFAAASREMMCEFFQRPPLQLFMAVEKKEKRICPKSKIQIKDIRSVGHGNRNRAAPGGDLTGSIQREIIILLVSPIERLLLS